MTNWNPRANDVYLQALELRSPDERAAYLDHACAGDAAFRAEVEELLEAGNKAGSFLQHSAHLLGATIDAPAPSERPGTVIGQYKLLQQIGEGGMGTVFMAEQTHPVQRRVALKVIKRGMDSSQVIARFEAERQALALMDHTNIARVLDAGTTETGRPYFVMELVHGVPITKYCDDNRLTPHERLELFVPVCHAIQHAHQKGIIHRDIKPSNVMITLYDGRPVPKVIDFGVAKATEQKLTERTLFTQFGTMVGTLEYMSPEQAEMSALGVDTRSDIYSLGVLLYELLTGGTPLPHQRLKDAAHAEILRMIKEVEPPKPSTRLSDSGEALASISADRHMEPARLTKLVRGDLDWIVMKCLEKDRSRRYETANGFAMDVQRYLANEPVQACPPSAGYRLRKFVRRNRGPVLAAGLVLLAIIAGVIGTSISTAMLWREQAQTKAAFENAQANLRLALEALDRIYIEEAEGHPRIREGLPKDLLQRGLGFYERFVKENAGNERLVSLMGSAYHRAGMIFRALGEERRAVESFERAISAYDRALLIDPRNTVANHNRGNALNDVGRFDEALAAHDRTIEIDPLDADAHNSRGGVLCDHFGRYEEAIAEFDRTIELSPGYASAYSNRGTALLRLGRLEEALDACEQAVELEPQKAWIHNSHAAVLLRLGRSEEAIAALDRAIKIDPQFTMAHLNRVTALRNLGRFQDALAACELALEISPRNAMLYDEHGITLHVMGRFEQALEAYDRAIAIEPRNAGTHDNRAITLFELGRFDESLAACDRVIELDPRNSRAHCRRGMALFELGGIEASLAACDRALEIDPADVRAHNGRGMALQRLGRFEEALAAIDRASELNPQSPLIHKNRGRLLCDDLGRPGEALEAFDCAIALDPADAGAHYNRSVALSWLGRLEESLAALDRVVELAPGEANSHSKRAAALGKLSRFEAALLESDVAIRIDSKYAEGYTNRARALNNLGRFEEAIAACDRAIGIDAHDALAHHNRAHALYKLGRFEEALAAFDRTLEIEPRNARAHNGRASALANQGKFEASLEAYAEVVRLRPDNPEDLYNLGLAFMRCGRFKEAVLPLRRGHELGTKRAGWPYPSRQLLDEAERKAELEDRRVQMLAGHAQPRNADERIEFAVALHEIGRHKESARMYAEAFADDVALVDDPAMNHRYNAACSAALASAAGGADAAEWRGRALEWLRAEFDARMQAAIDLASTFTHWKQDPDFASVRDHLDELSEPERAAWRGLWAEVDRALVSTRTAAK